MSDPGADPATPSARSTPPLLEILADGGPGVGAGHLGRCLALAQAWCGAGGVARLHPDAARPPGWAERYAALGADPGDPVDRPADVIVVDGYRYPADRLAALAAAAPVVAIDDHGTSGVRPSAVLVDQNLGADPARYSSSGAGDPLVLAGPRYALLRDDVVRARPAVQPDRAAAPRRVLVAAGGNPPPAVAELFAEVERLVAVDLGLEVVPLRGLTDVGSVLAAADLAVTAAGSTVWELALHGVPTVVVAVADNQEAVARAVGSAGVAVDAGDAAGVIAADLVACAASLVADPRRRDQLAAAGWALVDGRGARRVASTARSLLVHLRRATGADARQLWEWANDPAVRGAAFRPEPIAWDGHVAWLDAVLQAPDRAIWIATDPSGGVLGQVRIDDAATGEGVVDVSVAPHRRGSGWAAPMLVAACRRAAVELGPQGLQHIRADVLADNARSAQAFLAADFDRGPDGSHEGRAYQTYTRRCHG